MLYLLKNISNIKKLLEELELKASACGDNNKENRARKGAYVDCIVMLKNLIKNDKFNTLI